MCQKSYTLFFGTNFIKSYSPPPLFLVFVVWFSVFKIFYSQELGITFYPGTPPTSAWGDLSFFFSRKLAIPFQAVGSHGDINLAEVPHDT